MRNSLLHKSKHYRGSVAEPSIFGPVHHHRPSYQDLSKQLKLKAKPKALAFIGDPSAEAQGRRGRREGRQDGTHWSFSRSSRGASPSSTPRTT